MASGLIIGHAPKTIRRIVRVKSGPFGMIGLCEFSDGTREWRLPSTVSVQKQITRADGTAEARADINANLTGVS